MGLAVFIGRLAGFEQLSGKVVDDGDAVERGPHCDLVVQVADDDVHALSGERRRLRLRANERADADAFEKEPAYKGSAEEAGRPRDEDSATT
jgi:hypothetical protein